MKITYFIPCASTWFEVDSIVFEVDTCFLNERLVGLATEADPYPSVTKG